MQHINNSLNYKFTHIIVGDELGLIKKLEIDSSKELKTPKITVINRDVLDQPSPDKAVLTIRRFDELYYLNDFDLNNNNNNFLICSKTNRLQIYNFEKNKFVDIMPQKKNLRLSGSLPFRNKFVINCYENGEINLQNIEKEMIQFSNESSKKALKILGLDKNLNQNIFYDEDISVLNDKNVLNKNSKREKIFKSTKESLSKKGKFINETILYSDRQIYNPNFNTSKTTLNCFELEKNYLAIGGKNNNVKVFDIETENCIFYAKNSENHWLGFNNPTWISGISWLGKYSSSLLAVISKNEPIIKLYDIRSTDKPIMALNMKEKSTFHPNPPVFTTLCSIRSNFIENQNNHQLLVGSTIGRMILIDCRLNSQTYQTLCSFKGFSGSIRDIKHIPESNKKSLIVSCCLDRFVRIHSFEKGYDINKELTGKYYLKTKLTCLQPIFSDLGKNEQIGSN